MNFEFATAQRIIFGTGRCAAAIEALGAMGRRCLVVTNRNGSRADWLVSGLSEAGVATQVFSVPGEPDLETVQAGAKMAREFAADCVAAVGGGSAIDAAKAMAALATNHQPVLNYLEVIGQGWPLSVAPLPMVAIPTTAGTGSEVTRNAVLYSPAHRVKASLRHPRMLPALAVIDPGLTVDLPPGLTATTGMDALTQLIEPFLSARANPVSDALCREAIPNAALALPVAFRSGGNLEAREAMCLASLFGGLALANAGLGAVHGLAAAIGGFFQAPHGAVCSALLPQVMEVNYRALRERLPLVPILHRWDELAVLLTGDRTAGAADSLGWVAQLRRDLQLPGLSHYGVAAWSFAEVIHRAQQASSMQANPVVLTETELAEILTRSL